MATEDSATQDHTIFDLESSSRYKESSPEDQAQARKKYTEIYGDDSAKTAFAETVDSDFFQELPPGEQEEFTQKFNDHYFVVPESDSAIERGITGLKYGSSFAKDMTSQDYDSAAKGISEYTSYRKSNPSSKEAQEMYYAWEKGDGIVGGVKGVWEEIQGDIKNAEDFKEKLSNTWENIKGMGAGIIEQAPNMVYPMTGMAVGAFGGSYAGPWGAAGGAIAGGAAGNAIVEGQGIALEGLQEAGINPHDTQAVAEYLRSNSGELFKETAVKGAILSSVDFLTLKLGRGILTAPGRKAYKRALADSGVDVLDKKAVKAIQKTPEFIAKVKADKKFIASQKGLSNLGRNATVATLEPVGEFTGEFVGRGVSSGDWDTKGAALEAASSLGTSGATFAGQKAYQRIKDIKPTSQIADETGNVDITDPEAALDNIETILDNQGNDFIDGTTDELNSHVEQSVADMELEVEADSAATMEATKKSNIVEDVDSQVENIEKDIASKQDELLNEYHGPELPQVTPTEQDTTILKDTTDGTTPTTIQRKIPTQTQKEHEKSKEDVELATYSPDTPTTTTKKGVGVASPNGHLQKGQPGEAPQQSFKAQSAQKHEEIKAKIDEMYTSPERKARQRDIDSGKIPLSELSGTELELWAEKREIENKLFPKKEDKKKKPERLTGITKKPPEEYHEKWEAKDQPRARTFDDELAIDKAAEKESRGDASKVKREIVEYARKRGNKKKGILPTGGINIASAEANGLDIEDRKELTKLQRMLFVKDGGMPLDEVAGELGYDGTDALVQAWKGATTISNKKKEIVARLNDEWDIASDLEAEELSKTGGIAAGNFSTMKEKLAKDPEYLTDEEIELLPNFTMDQRTELFGVKYPESVVKDNTNEEDGDIPSDGEQPGTTGNTETVDNEDSIVNGEDINPDPSDDQKGAGNYKKPKPKPKSKPKHKSKPKSKLKPKPKKTTTADDVNTLDEDNLFGDDDLPPVPPDTEGVSNEDNATASLSKVGSNTVTASGSFPEKFSTLVAKWLSHYTPVRSSDTFLLSTKDLEKLHNHLGGRKVTDKDIEFFSMLSDDEITNRIRREYLDEAVKLSKRKGDEVGIAIARVGDGQYVVVIPDEQIGTPEGLEITAHEIGHVATYDLMAKQDKATISALKKSHRRWLKRHGLNPSQSPSIVDLITSLSPPLVANQDLSKMSEASGLSIDELTSAKASQLKRVDLAYIKSFKEWIANETSKYLTGGKKPKGLVEEFFYDLAQVMKKFVAGITGNKHVPDSVVVAWLEGKNITGRAVAPPKTKIQTGKVAKKRKARKTNKVLDDLGMDEEQQRMMEEMMGIMSDEHRTIHIIDGAKKFISDDQVDKFSKLSTIMDKMLEKADAKGQKATELVRDMDTAFTKLGFNGRPYIQQWVANRKQQSQRGMTDADVERANEDQKRNRSDRAGKEPTMGIPLEDEGRDGTETGTGVGDSVSSGKTGIGESTSDGVGAARGATDGKKGSASGGKSKRRASGSTPGNTHNSRISDSDGEGIQPDRGTPATNTPDARKAELDERLAAQEKANSNGEGSSIAEDLPLLFKEQQEDVEFIEARLEDNRGVLLTNGTGTGKTFSALGAIRRYINKNGDDNILIIQPSVGIAKGWVDAGKNFDINVHKLKNTKDAGKGVTITSYANAYQNNELMKRDFGMIVFDESHYLKEKDDFNASSRLQAFRAITGHEKGNNKYVQMVEHELLGKMNSLSSKIDILMKSDDNRNWAEARSLEPELKSLRDKYENRRQGHLKQLGRKWRNQDTKTLFLSATPFAYNKSLDYAEGFLFDYDDSVTRIGNSRQSGREDFFVKNLGYRIRYHKLTEPEVEVDIGLMQRELTERLKSEGAIRGRKLDIDQDYSREFVLTADSIGQKIDEFFSHAREKGEELRKEGRLKDSTNIELLMANIKNNWKFHQRQQTIEAIKARHIIDRANKHIALGRKVVLFHDFINGGGVNFTMRPTAGKAEQKGWDILNESRPDLMGMDLSGLRNPLDLIKEEFGDKVIFYNGTVSDKDKALNPGRFNNDPNIDMIMVQSIGGKEGISLHDTVGDKQRVIMNIGMPFRPTQMAQIEGRIYRLGQESNAIFEYFNTDTAFERMTFAETISGRAAGAENLALGKHARNLQASIVDAFDNATTADPSIKQGIGGKAKDAADTRDISPFERAKSYYFANLKRNQQTKSMEGIDYFPTPEPLGLKMVEWADIKPGDSVLEPSAGHGAIARFFPSNTRNTVVEPSGELTGTLSLRTGNAKPIQDDFENHNIINKYDAIIMNPPYGKGGATAIKHIAKAAKHLKNGGRIVAILPDGPAANNRFNQWYATNVEAEDIAIVEQIPLPNVTFSRTGTKVKTVVVVLEKSDSFDNEGIVKSYTPIKSGTIKEFFDDIEYKEVPGRAEVGVDTTERLREAYNLSVVATGNDKFPYFVGGKGTFSKKEIIKRVAGKGKFKWNREEKYWMVDRDISEELLPALETESSDSRTVKLDNSFVGKFNNNDFAGAAEDIVLSKSRKEIVEKLETLFGPRDASEPMATSDEFLGDIALDYEADLEYAANNRDTKEVEELLYEVFAESMAKTPFGYGVQQMGEQLEDIDRRLKEKGYDIKERQFPPVGSSYAPDSPPKKIQDKIGTLGAGTFIDSFVAGQFVKSAKDLASSKSRNEIVGKLDVLFGPQDLTEPFFGSDAAMEFQADLEHAANNRDTKEVVELLRSAYKDMFGGKTPSEKPWEESGAKTDTQRQGSLFGGGNKTQGNLFDTGKKKTEKKAPTKKPTPKKTAQAKPMDMFASPDSKQPSLFEPGVVYNEEKRLPTFPKPDLSAKNPKLRELWHGFIYNWTDIHDPRKRVLRSTGKEHDAATDILTIERSRGKKTAEDTERFMDETVKPFLKLAAENEIPVSNVEEFKYALHVPERNEQMQRVNAKRYLNALLGQMTGKQREPWIVTIKQAQIDNKINEGTVQELHDEYLEIMDMVYNDLDTMQNDLANDQQELDDREFTAAEKSKGTPERLQQRLDKRVERLGVMGEIQSTWEERSPRFAGITDQDAQLITDKYNADPKKAIYDKLGTQMDKINRGRLDILRNSGELSAEEYEGLTTLYEHYVPLHRDGFEETSNPTGRVTGPTGKPLQVAKGSMREVVDIFANTVMNHQTAINRAHKSEAGEVLYNFAKENPDAGIKVEPQEKKPTHDREGNIVMYPDAVEPSDGVFVKVQGKRYTLKFDIDSKTEKGRTLKRFLDSIKTSDVPLLPAFKWAMKVNQFLAKMNTMFSPEFIISNFTKDIQTAWIHVSDTAASGMQAKIAKDVGPAIRGIWGAECGKKLTEMGKLYRDFAAHGGKIGWLQGYETIEDLSKELENTMKLYQKGHITRKSLKGITDVVKHANTAIENGVRLATYKALLEVGETKEQAALAAANLTVDFTRHGKYGPVLNSLYMFANAGIQGNVRMIKAAKRSPKVRAMMGGIVLAGFTMGMLAYAVGGDDDMGEPFIEGIPQFEKERNMIIPLPWTEKGYQKIPIPYGYNSIYGLGMEIARAAHNGWKSDSYDPLEGAMRVVTTAMNSFNPMASATLAQTLTPTVLDPIAMVVENKDPFGRDLMPSNSPYGPPKPNSERYWKSAREPSKFIAKQLNKMTGGDEFEGGAADISPETFDVVFDTITGSAGRFIANTFDTVDYAARKYIGGDKEATIEKRKIPFLRRAYGETSDYLAAKRYREKKLELEIFKKRYDTAEGSAKSELYRDPRKRQLGMLKSYDSSIRKMNKRLDKLEAVDNKKAAEIMKERIMEKQKDFLSRVK